MKFNSKMGQEVRTWILFFVGITLAIVFAIKGVPLNPWWTLVIGAFTCTAIIVSAVQATVGGISDVSRKAIEDARRATDDNDTQTKISGSSFSITLGISFVISLFNFYSDYTIAI